jgi:hypothetical protein
MRISPDLIATATTGLYVVLELAAITVAVVYRRVWRSRASTAMSATKLVRYRRASFLLFAWAGLILVRLLTHTYN